MKLMTAYQQHISLDSFYQQGYQTLTLCHPFLSVRAIDPLSLEKIQELLEYKEIDFYLKINRFFFEPELKELKELLNDIKNLSLKGIIISDIGVFMMLKELGYSKEIILETDTTLTSSADINVYLEQGISGVVVARELTIDEMIQIAHDIKGPTSINFFGHQLMSTSRRQLLEAYGEHEKLSFDKDKLYKMKEATRPNSSYLIMEDNYGTHVYHGSMLNGLNDIDRLEVFKYLIVDPLLMPDELLFDIGNMFRYGTISNEELIKKYPTISFSRALWDIKTTDKKEKV